MKSARFYAKDGTIMQFEDWTSWRAMWKRVRHFYKRSDIVKVVEYAEKD